MFRILDRYLAREILLPFAIGLVVLTFVMMMPPILEQGQQLIEKGVDLVTFFRILLTIAPSALCITIPMALLFGVLMGLGRLSSDREFVAMQACGVSIFRALRPIALLAVLAFAADQYVMLVALPNANQTFREVTFNVVASKAETDVKPRSFYQGFDKRVIYARDIIPGGAGWRDVFLADSSRPDQTDVYFASRGRLIIDREKRTVQLVLENGSRHSTFLARPEEYEPSSFERIILNMDADAVFRRVTLLKGDNEMTIRELREIVAQNTARGQPSVMQLFTIHQKFSIPVSCLVLAAIGLALGASNRKDGTLASFALGTGVIFVYYVLLYMGRAGASGGRLNPQLAPWLVNILLGVAGAVLVVWRAGASGEAVRIPLPRWPGSSSDATAARHVRGAGRIAGRRGDPDPADRHTPSDVAGPVRRPPLHDGVHAGISLADWHFLHRNVHRPCGQAVSWHDHRLDAAPVFLLPDAAVHLLHRAAGGAAVHARDDRRPDEKQRAHRDARLRHQPLSVRDAARAVRGHPQRHPLWFARVRARRVESRRRAS